MQINRLKSYLGKRWYVIPALLLWCFFYLPFLPYHLLHIDESVYILVAKSMLSGGVPYCDIWDHKPPMIFFLFSLILNIFGSKNYFMINVVCLLFLLLSTLTLYKIARRFLPAVGAGLVCYMYPIISNVLLGRDAVTPNTEIYMVAFAMMGIVFVFRYLNTFRTKNMFLAGLSIGIATAFKQPSATILLPIVASVLLTAYHNRSRWKHFCLGLVTCAAAIASIWLVLIAYFASNGILRDFWFQCFQFNLIYSGDISKIDIIRGLWRIYRQSFIDLPFFFIPYALGFIGIIVALSKRNVEFRQRLLLTFLLLWHIADIIGMSAGGLFYPHYLVQWVPSFVLVAVAGLFLLCKPLVCRYPIMVRTAVAIYLLAIAYPTFVTGISYRNVETAVYVKHDTPLQHWRFMRRNYRIIGPNYLRYPYFREPKDFFDTLNTIKIIRSFVPPDGTMFIWGFIPELYLVADRAPASRFIFTSFVTGRFYGLQNLHFNPIFNRMHTYIEVLLLGDLTKNKPNLIVVSDKKRFSASEAFFEFLDKEYRKLSIQSRYPVDLYVRKDYVGSQKSIGAEKQEPHYPGDQ